MRGIWTPYVLGPQDDWSNVANGDDRKRIQNRLAQRARRANLKARQSTVGSNSESGGHELGGLFGEDGAASGIGLLMNESPNEWNQSQLDRNTTGPRSITEYRRPFSNNWSTLYTLRVLKYRPSPPDILPNQPAPHIRPPNVSMPSHLTPTQLQKTIPHLPFVDIIPIPGVRDRLLRSADAVDQAKLMQDLVEDAFRVWGDAAWDGMGWEVSETFARKWWFLIDEQLLNATNFWRRQRLEGTLLMNEGGDVSVQT
ncbi:hypothetical protein PT974_00310 [Cladobotryum mycophilum]|uniref:BZIP domain-containing protein n=1 Tax=Cladobotryum mycophilum TaxID=491253 RepID=A0ABR0T0S0_9HYPO